MSYFIKSSTAITGHSSHKSYITGYAKFICKPLHTALCLFYQPLRLFRLVIFDLLKLVFESIFGLVRSNTVYCVFISREIFGNANPSPSVRHVRCRIRYRIHYDELLSVRAIVQDAHARKITRRIQSGKGKARRSSRPPTPDGTQLHGHGNRRYYTFSYKSLTVA